LRQFFKKRLYSLFQRVCGLADNNGMGSMSVSHDLFPVTSGWLALSPVPPLTGVGATAERLVLLAHYGADFDVWGGARRVKYWDALADRVKAATYSGRTLTDWWETVSRLLPSEPRNSGERRETVCLVYSGDDLAVLRVLRDHAAALVLRVRLVSEARRNAVNSGALGDSGTLGELL